MTYESCEAAGEKELGVPKPAKDEEVAALLLRAGVRFLDMAVGEPDRENQTERRSDKESIRSGEWTERERAHEMEMRDGR